ncbi:class I SAM-dependent methyltransferase [Acidithiobacillus sp. AMEEHan]|uniref:class I SAM-dependent methyltransferase n=1 Tax=Acidithiobacillus sp. AMEEHan TaxID=2994951 RepID=UPI0027E3EF10|nr:class I SAM-dependent methyltransferase [Acidithiobacillus sp. AMEEHan]
MSKRSLQRAYDFWAPIYDWAVIGFSRGPRAANIAEIPSTASTILVVGAGTGLDLPLLPPQAFSVALDLSWAMLSRARARAKGAQFLQADAEALPIASASCDVVLLHLILAVVPHAEEALAEASRVLRPGGTLLIFDKFLRPGQRALLRRLLAPLSGTIATRTDLVFETLLARHPELALESDVPAAVGGWFRRLRLRKAA